MIKPTSSTLTHVVSLTDTPPFTNLHIAFVSPCWRALRNLCCKSFSLGSQDAIVVDSISYNELNVCPYFSRVISAICYCFVFICRLNVPNRKQSQHQRCHLVNDKSQRQPAHLWRVYPQMETPSTRTRTNYFLTKSFCVNHRHRIVTNTSCLVCVVSVFTIFNSCCPSETSNSLLCSIYKTEATCRTSWQ